MKFALILTYFLTQPSYDGGAAVHTTRIEFGTMARCEAAAAKIKADPAVAQLEHTTRIRIRVSAVCIEAY
jgi:hypothetical protein